MTEHLSRALACLAGAVLVLAFLHTWGTQPERWVLLDANRQLLAQHDSLGSCWSDGAARFDADWAFSCARK